MVLIKCINSKCTAPDRIFPWNERPHLEAEGKLVEVGDEGAVSFIVLCKFCGTRNKIWVTKVREIEVVRDIGEVDY